MSYNAELVERVVLAAQRFTVYGPRVMVLRDSSEAISKGGIHIPEGSQRNEKVGTIVKIGAGYESVAEQESVEGLTVGHRVTFNAYDGVSHTIPVGDLKIEVLVMHAGNLYMGWTRKTAGEHNAS